MKNTINKFFLCLTLISTIGFTNCENSNDNLDLELTIQEKIAILQTGEWLLKDFEDRVMHTFANGERFTFYGTNSDFSEPAIPGTQDYSISGDLLTMDFHFGNTGTYDLKVSCDNNIVEFFVDGELHSTYYKRGSNYQDCL